MSAPSRGADARLRVGHYPQIAAPAQVLATWQALAEA
jgi:hypothetical protein